ncbi:MAG: DUF192 domain-containing protein [Candidatus Sericytochromatia bacterium]|nr:DUF192 domain-containing protein [Candidatus Tanganyikabacteria bacterium]
MPGLWLGERSVVDRLEVARTPWARLRGLGFREHFKPGEGMLLVPCNSIHTLWPRLSLDVLFLSRDFRILRVLHDLPPGRFSPIVLKAWQVLELPAGQARVLGLEEGMTLRWEP